jgi:glycosyltransferase involved in cell wall biosynthesis
MLLGIPVVVSDDPALLEVTDGRAVVVTDDGPQTLAGAIDRALNLTEDEIAAAAEHARTFTWERTAGQMRDALRAGAIS